VHWTPDEADRIAGDGYFQIVAWTLNQAAIPPGRLMRQCRPHGVER
jgi:hypothetical protein